MGRLENFIPTLKKARIEIQNNKTCISVGANNPLPVEEDLVPFLKQVNGHFSLREIFSFLNKKNQPIHIERSLNLMQILAKRDYLYNSGDFIKAYDPNSTPVVAKHNPHLNNLKQSYFSHERLVGLVQKTTLFSQCERKTAERILEHSSLENVQEGIKLLKEGTKSSDFYILLAGEVGVFKKKACLAHLTPLSVFGESAAIFDKERNADIITTSPCWLLKIDAHQLVDTKAPESFEAFNGLKSQLILNQTIASNPLFQNVPSDVLQLFISHCRIEKYAKEQSIITQGDMSGDFYFVLKGSVAIIKDSVPVTSLGEGEHFGEVAAMFHEPRTATVLTETNCTLLVLNQKSLFEVLCSHFRLAVSIERTAQKRKSSKDNVLNLFEDTFVPEDSQSIVPQKTMEFEIDDEFLEATDTHFDLELFDFSKIDEDAS